MPLELHKRYCYAKNRWPYINFSYLINTLRIEAEQPNVSSYWNFLKQAISASFRPSKINYQYIILQLEPTLNCNLNCNFCSHEVNNPAFNLGPENFERILRQFPYLHQINLTGIGEAFVNPQIFEIIKLAKNRGIYLRITTNGILLSEEINRQLVENKVDEIRVSIDAVDEGLFKELRGGASITEILDNIRCLNKIKKEHKNNFPVIEFNTTISMRNYKELSKIVNLAFSLNISGVYCTNLINKFNDKDIEKLLLFNNDIYKKDIIEEFMQAISLARRYRIALRLPNIYIRKTVCCLPWILPYVTYDGDILPCCMTVNFRGSANYIKWGNVFKNRSDEIINGQIAIDFRNNLRNKRYPYICKDCLVKNGVF